MTAVGLERMIKKFKKTGSFHDQSATGSKWIHSSLVVEVSTAVHEELSADLKMCKKYSPDIG